jgi:hypothetical protein
MSAVWASAHSQRLQQARDPVRPHAAVHSGRQAAQPGPPIPAPARKQPAGAHPGLRLSSTSSAPIRCCRMARAPASMPLWQWPAGGRP